MQVQRINITLPITILKALQADVPAGKRSKFIANALSSKLGKKKNLEAALERSLKANYNLDKKLRDDWAITETEGWPE